MDFRSSFDLDLSTGLEGEQSVAHILSISTVEVKTDFMCSKTGNIAVEYKCRGVPSGISITKATHWAFLIPQKCLIVIKTDRLKELCKIFFEKGSKRRGGDDNKSLLILIPISEIIK